MTTPDTHPHPDQHPEATRERAVRTDTLTRGRATVTITVHLAGPDQQTPKRFTLAGDGQSLGAFRAVLTACPCDRESCPGTTGHRIGSPTTDTSRRGQRCTRCHGWHWPLVRALADRILNSYDTPPRSRPGGEPGALRASPPPASSPAAVTMTATSSDLIEEPRP